MVRLALPFLFGLLLARSLPVGGWMGPACLAGLLALTTVALQRRSRFEQRALRGATVSLFLVFFGLVWGTLKGGPGGPRGAGPVISSEQDLLVRLDLVDRSRSGYWRADSEVLAQRVGSEARLTGELLRLTLAPDSAHGWLRPGDLLWIRTRPEPIDRVPDPGGFDLRSWTASRGIHREAFVGRGAWVPAGHHWRWMDAFADAREQVTRWLEESGLPQAEQDVARALLLGDRSGLEQVQRDAFARSGTMHVLAVSGLHVGLVFAVVATLLGWWGNRRGLMWLRGLLILAALWGYAGLTGGAPSVVRAATMFTLFTAAGIVGRQSDSLNSLAAAAFGLLVWDPRMLGQLSFQFSFLAVLGILLFHDPLRRLWVPPNRVLGYLWSLLVVSVAAQLMTTPLALLTFKAFPVWFLPANLVVVSLVTVAVYGGGILLLVYKVPLLGNVVAFLMTWILKALAGSTRFFAELPGAYPDLRLDWFQAVLLYGLIVAVAARLAWRWRPGWAVTVMVLLALCVTWARTARSNNGREAFVAYGGGTGLELALVHGRDMVVFSDRNDDLAQRRTEAHRRAWGLRSVRQVPAVERGDGPLVVPGDWPILGLDLARSAGTAEGKWLILAGDQRVDLDELVALGAEGVLLSPSMPGGKRSYLRRALAERSIPSHDLREQGAYILQR
ncbi:MAG: ComEC/Rec2 family competence protein [Flavobacteriales bacterium]|nr:ComEC/Rec2 family competence protein [Flavobacteriales bacterium]